MPMVIEVPRCSSCSSRADGMTWDSKLFCSECADRIWGATLILSPLPTSEDAKDA